MEKIKITHLVHKSVKVFLISLFTAFSLMVNAKDNAGKTKDKADKLPFVCNYPEQMPEYPGGDAALMHLIKDSICYPEIEKERDIQGKVILSFRVDEEGCIQDLIVKRGVSPGLDKEALRVARLLKKFTPGKQSGKPVSVYFILPISFKINEVSKKN